MVGRLILGGTVTSDHDIIDGSLILIVQLWGGGGCCSLIRWSSVMVGSLTWSETVLCWTDRSTFEKYCSQISLTKSIQPRHRWVFCFYFYFYYLFLYKCSLLEESPGIFFQQSLRNLYEGLRWKPFSQQWNFPTTPKHEGELYLLLFQLSCNNCFSPSLVEL